jgi:hypothetical protein
MVRDRSADIEVTAEMRLVGAIALENLEEVGSYEDKAEAAYIAMAATAPSQKKNFS